MNRYKATICLQMRDRSQSDKTFNLNFSAEDDVKAYIKSIEIINEANNNILNHTLKLHCKIKKL